MTGDPDQFSADDYRYMARALRLAALGLNSTDPNPRVGCVLVRDGRVVGEGWHRHAGDAHAEIVALESAGEHARGARCYVSLEPCCHHGRTGPCSQALITAGVGEVIAAMTDPNPRVAGGGLRALRQAGIPARAGLLQNEAEALNPGFIQRLRTGRPWLRVKLGMSLDGRTAMASGESQWITSAQARADVQRLRARSSAILTGVNTVLADDPALTVRTGDGEQGLRQPLRVVLDSQLRMPAVARMLGRPGRTLIITGSDDESRAAPLLAAGAELERAEVHQGRVGLHAMLQILSAREINEVLVEAGPILTGALTSAGLVDEFVIYMAPKLLGSDARGLLNLPAMMQLADAVQLDFEDIRRIGPDWRISARPRR